MNEGFKRGVVSKKVLITTGAIVIVAIVLTSAFFFFQYMDTMDYTYESVISELKLSILEKMTNIPGLSIALIDGSDLVWTEGFGYTDHTRQHMVTPDTIFSIQSISKVYSATGFLIAVSKGLVKLDESLKKYYQDFRVNSRFGENEADKITFRHLLSHWSGLTHEAPVGNNFDASSVLFEEHIESISDTWLKYPVGERNSYSNLGIDLVGYALQLISNKSFIEYMEDELFEPLGMGNTTCDQKYVVENSIFAKGHIGSVEAPQQMIPMIPAGSVFSSARDMAKFVSFHLSGGVVNGRRLIEEEVLKEMYEPQFPVKNQVGGYGLGTASVPAFNTTFLFHTGGGYGYLTAQGWLPEYNIGVVVLTNQYWPNDNSQSAVYFDIAIDAITKMIKAKYGLIPEDEPISFIDKPVINLEIDKLYRLEGNYRARSGIISVTVVKIGQHEELWWPGEKLSPHSETEFTTPTGDLITFKLDEEGKPEGIQHLLADGNFYYPLDNSPNDKPGPNKEEWLNFTGYYNGIMYGNPFSVHCTIKNGYLYVDFMGEAKLTEYEPSIFFTCDGEAVIFGNNNMTYGNIPLTKMVKSFSEEPTS